MSFNIVYITFGSEADAQRISTQLIEERLAACANIFPIKSLYWWRDVIQSEDEWVVIVKTTTELWPVLKSRVEELHPYEVPCIMKIEVEANEKYEEWIKGQTEKR
ncbi:MAG TPA: divalent-cation tolerance protein CutA [Saprospiraceae bacterium]|nr:divalent-cation tolerance protein CutA [Saprospiraceae bacterium]